MIVRLRLVVLEIFLRFFCAPPCESAGKSELLICCGMKSRLYVCAFDSLCLFGKVFPSFFSWHSVPHFQFWGNQFFLFKFLILFFSCSLLLMIQCHFLGSFCSRCALVSRRCLLLSGNIFYAD